MVWAVGNIVGLVYWSVLFPAQVHDMKAGKFVDTLAAHGMTTAFAWSEMVCVAHPFDRPKVELPLIVGFALTYLAWNIYCESQNHHWAYPEFQAKLSMAIPAYCGITVFGVGVYFGGRCLSRRLHAASREGSAVEGLLGDGGEDEDAYSIQPRDAGPAAP